MIYLTCSGNYNLHNLRVKESSVKQRKLLPLFSNTIKWCHFCSRNLLNMPLFLNFLLKYGFLKKFSPPVQSSFRQSSIQITSIKIVHCKKQYTAQFPADLATFTEEMLHFLCSDSSVIHFLVFCNPFSMQSGLLQASKMQSFVTIANC